MTTNASKPASIDQIVSSVYDPVNGVINTTEGLVVVPDSRVTKDSSAEQILNAVYDPSTQSLKISGGGSGSGVDSVNGLQGAVSIGIHNLDDVDNTVSTNDADVLQYSTTAGKWVHKPFALPTANRAAQTDPAGKIVPGAATSAEQDFLAGVTGSIQTQINSKEPTIPTGTTSEYIRANKTLSNFITDARAAFSASSTISIVAGAISVIQSALTIAQSQVTGLVSSLAAKIGFTDLSASSPLSYNNSNGLFSVQKSDATHDGYLSLVDWNTFNNASGGNLTDIQANTAHIGIKIADNPTHKFSVGSAQTAVVGQDTIGGATSFVNPPNVIWQSLTEVQGYNLNKVTWTVGNLPAGNYIVSLYQGNGIGGTLLYQYTQNLASAGTGDVDFNYPVSQSITAQQYTHAIAQSPGVNNYTLLRSTTSVYAGGQSNQGAGIDYRVRTSGFIPAVEAAYVDITNKLSTSQTPTVSDNLTNKSYVDTLVFALGSVASVASTLAKRGTSAELISAWFQTSNFRVAESGGNLVIQDAAGTQTILTITPGGFVTQNQVTGAFGFPQLTSVQAAAIAATAPSNSEIFNTVIGTFQFRSGVSNSFTNSRVFDIECGLNGSGNGTKNLAWVGSSVLKMSKGINWKITEAYFNNGIAIPSGGSLQVFIAVNTITVTGFPQTFNTVGQIKRALVLAAPIDLVPGDELTALVIQSSFPGNPDLIITFTCEAR